MSGKLNIPKMIAIGIGGACVALLFLFLYGYIVMLLWNWLMPAIFGLPLIGYWQAWGLCLLSRLLFGQDRRHSGRNNCGKAKNKCGDGKSIKEKFKKWLSDEETAQPEASL